MQEVKTIFMRPSVGANLPAHKTDGPHVHGMRSVPHLQTVRQPLSIAIERLR
jgi:hypothetical protein